MAWWVDVEFGEKLCTPMKKARKEEKESGKGRSFFSLWFFFSPAIKSNRPSTPSIIMISSPPMQRAIDLHPRFIIIALDIFIFWMPERNHKIWLLTRGL